MNKNILGPAIKYLRKYRRMTQTDLSKKTNFKQSTISGHETQFRSLDELDIKIYAEALSVKPQTLFTIAEKIENGEVIKDGDIDLILDQNHSTPRSINKDNRVDTIAAHLEGKEITEEEMNDVLEYINKLFNDKFNK